MDVEDGGSSNNCPAPPPPPGSSGSSSRRGGNSGSTNGGDVNRSRKRRGTPSAEDDDLSFCILWSPLWPITAFLPFVCLPVWIYSTLLLGLLLYRITSKCFLLLLLLLLLLLTVVSFLSVLLLLLLFIDRTYGDCRFTWNSEWFPRIILRRYGWSDGIRSTDTLPENRHRFITRWSRTVECCHPWDKFSIQSSDP